MKFDWPTKLYRKRGGPRRLLGLMIYYDFRWLDLFSDRRAQFQNGLSLAKLAVAECPPGKEPALLLTTFPDAREVPIETETEYVLVVRIKDYLRRSGSDPAAAYYAHKIDGSIAALGQFSDREELPGRSGKTSSDGITLSRVKTWLEADPSRIAQLSAIDVSIPSRAQLNPAEVVEALRAMDSVDPEVWSALVDLLPRLVDDEARRAFLDAITQSKSGRQAAVEALGARITQRIADARNTARRFRALLKAPSTTEVDLQRFIEGNPWLVGLDYVRVRPRFAVPRGELDFILERFDGFHDIMELKDPSDPIVVAPDAIEGKPPSASQYSLSSALANALAQVHVYRDVLGVGTATIEEFYGLPNARHPRLVIVIGQVSHLPADRARVLEELNRSLHRVEVVPYDVLAKRADAWLKVLEDTYDPPLDSGSDRQGDHNSSSGPVK